MRREHWHLTEGLIFVHFAVFLLTAMSPEGRSAAWSVLALVPGQVGARPWSLVTYQFLHGGMISFFISMLVLWIMARPLEEEWGSPRFLAFWAVSVLGAAGAAILVGVPLTSDVFLAASLLFTYATLYPDVQFLLFFILPVKVKYLAIVGGAFLVFQSLQLGLLAGLVNLVGMSAGYLFFLATRRLPSKRKVVFELKKRKADLVSKAQDASVESRNRDWDPRVRAAIGRARDTGRVVDDDQPLLEELDRARDPSITVCAPADFGFVDDPVCRACPGYPECAARRIRMAAEDGAGDES